MASGDKSAMRYLQVLDPRGRCGMREYLCISGFSLLAASPLLAVLAIDGVPDHIRRPAVGVLWLIAAVMWIVSVRRSHDVGYRAWDAVWLAGGPTLFLVFWITLPAFGVFLPSLLLLLIAIGALLLCTVGGYSLGQSQSDLGANRYGPPTYRRITASERARYEALAARQRQPSRSGRS